MKLILAPLALFALPIAADIFKFWCGKPYNATASHFRGYNMGWPDRTYDLPHGQEYNTIKAVQGRVPYLTTDTDTTIVAFVPQVVFDQTQQMSVTVSIPSLSASTVIAPHQAVNGVSFAADASQIAPGISRLAVDITYDTFDNFTMAEAYLETVYMDLYKAPPPPGNTSVAALDTLTQTISVNGGNPFIPIGYYVSNDAMFSGDFASVDEFVKQYASEGYNTMMHAGSIASNQTQMLWTLELCQKYGIFYQADVTPITGNITALGDFVDQWTKYPAFLSYYIGNEPDGNIGIGSLEPSQSKYAYDYLKFYDPYHPVTLVTNCAHTMPFFDGNVDFIMTDVYSIGIPDHFQGLVCNATQGDCGCDLCDSTNPLRAVADRFDYIYADVGVNYPAITFVEQTFYDPGAYWPRPPTYSEEFDMAWLSVVAGSTGVLGYTYPASGDPSQHPALGLALSDFAANLAAGSLLAQRTFLSGARLSYGQQQAVYYASWPSGCIVAVNTDYTSSYPVAFFASDLGISPTVSEYSAQSLGRNATSNKTRRVKAKDGLLVDSVDPLGVNVYFPS